ncbi:hypothetical protein [Rathayibacter tritici]|uniref:Peptidoglycan binding-like domain-containing protein n=1 Tax=Rathayibacter tritici TaxID=33888 RepID=A0A160KRR7_9MICO|nr:hypothetical protein [Rathayibacter tritici]AND16014.1 hypothetical protein A6122_0861 [Rathayibacter tritici]PPI42006.1 hypothetical protein C5D18_13655 [Rathayibacter tritici]
MAAEPDGDAVARPGWVARPALIGVFVAVVLLVAGSAFWWGRSLRTPESVAVDASTTVVPVDVAVESRVVAESARLQGEVVAGTTLPVEAVRPRSAARAVVTAVHVEVGQEVGAGMLLAEVSDRPVFVLSMDVPPYRALTAGERGEDVTRFQEALAEAGLDVVDSGVVDEQTQGAIRDLYDRADAEPPGGIGPGTSVDLGELVILPGPSAVVASVAAVGTVLSEGASGAGSSTTAAASAAPGQPSGGSGPTLAELRTAPDAVRARASVISVDDFTVGTDVTLTGEAGASATGTVSSIGAFSTDSSSGAGYDVQVTFAQRPEQGFAIGRPVSVATGRTGEPVPAVPLVAVLQEDGKTFVQPTGDPEATLPPRIEIGVREQADGWASFDPTDALPVGALVRVPR